jgi:uncharacterized protein with HEPN domain
MNSQSGTLREMGEAIDAVTRYVWKGCSGAACDLARGAWMGNQLAAVGRAAVVVPEEVRAAYAGIPWDTLSALADEQGGVASMSADEMQRFVERELPRVKQALKQGPKPQL